MSFVHNTTTTTSKILGKDPEVVTIDDIRGGMKKGCVVEEENFLMFLKSGPKDMAIMNLAKGVRRSAVWIKPAVEGVGQWNTVWEDPGL